MKHQQVTFAVVAAALSLGAFAGCYTKLMPFKDAVETRHASVSHNQGGNFTSDLNYRENCLSCHSEAELNDRAADMDYAGIHTVHGIAYDPYGWQNPYTQPPWWEPNPPIFIGVAAGSGQQPVLTKNPPAAVSTSRSSNADRRRVTGSSRGTERTRDANPTGSVAPTPSTPTTPTGSTGTGAVTTTPSTTSQTPAPAPASTTDTRSRSTGSGETPTRKTGSGRE